MAHGPDSATVRQFRALFEAGTVAALTDGQLLERFLEGRGEGREAAFAALVARHGPMVLGVCRRALADPNDAADAFQATFLVLVRKARSVRVDDSLGRWLYGVSRKVAARARVVAGRRPKGDVGEIDSIAAPLVDPDRFEPLELLDEELGRLPEAFRSAIVLCDLEGLTHEEAARDLLIPVGTIKSRLARGRQKLRMRLERRGLTPSALALAPIVPASLSRATARLAWASAMASSQGAGVVPAASVVLAQEVLKAMTGLKLKLAAAAVLSLGIAATGAGVLAGGQQAEDRAKAVTGVVAEGSPRSDEAPSCVVQILDDRITLDGVRVSLADLKKVLGARKLDNKPARMAYVEGANDRKYSDVSPVIKAIEAAGVEDIRFRKLVPPIEAKLAQPITVNFNDQPLGEAVASLQDYTGLNIVLDPRALNDLGLSKETKVNLTANGVRLSLVLTYLLRPLGLAYVVEADVLLITEIPGLDRGSRNILSANMRAKLERAKASLARAEKIFATPQDPILVRHRKRVADLESAIEQFNNAIRIAQESLKDVQADPRPADGPAPAIPSEFARKGNVYTQRVLQAGPGPAIPPKVGQKANFPRELAKVSMPDYVVEPPDIITVEVLKALPDRPITGERLVRPDGTISLGYYGDVYVAGLNTTEIKAKLIQHLRKHLDDETLGLSRLDPQTGKKVDPAESDRVFVVVTSYNSKVYYVQGDVGVPGRLPITGNETVLDAINYAGGLIPTAAKAKIVLVRPASPGAQGGETLPVDLDAIVHRGDTTTNYQMFPGDRLIVYRDPKVVTQEIPAAKPEAVAPPDVEARLQAVERKLDEVLKALERSPKP